MWEPMSNGSGQRMGDIWRLHAYAHRATASMPARWAVYRHTVKVAEGESGSLARARAAAEAALAAGANSPSPGLVPSGQGQH